MNKPFHLKAVVLGAFALAASCCYATSPNSAASDFDRYRVDVYHGPLHSLKGYTQDASVGWRDDEGKAVDPPRVNFGGRYYVATHSCGAGCRYFTMIDMETGKESGSLEMFNSEDPPPRTKEGYPYVTELVMQPDSRLLIARYHIDAQGRDLCRERTFLMDDSLRVLPLGDTRMTCGK